MPLTQTERSLPSYELGRLSKGKLLADFSGGEITSGGSFEKSTAGIESASGCPPALQISGLPVGCNMT